MSKLLKLTGKRFLLTYFDAPVGIFNTAEDAFEMLLDRIERGQDPLCLALLEVEYFNAHRNRSMSASLLIALSILNRVMSLLALTRDAAFLRTFS